MGDANARITRRKAPVFPGISDSVRVREGDLLFVSGVIGLEADGSVPAEFERSVELAFLELERALREGGASLSDIVRVNAYIVALDGERLAAYRAVRDRFLTAGEEPASTLIGVAGLVLGAPFEIDAVAAV